MLSSALTRFFLTCRDSLVVATFSIENSQLLVNYQSYNYPTLNCCDADCICVSPSGDYICLSDSAKRLTFTHNENGVFTNISVKEIPRRAACVQFSPDEQSLILGEKSGNLYRLPVDKSEGDFQSPVLGHLSILSDAAISADSKLLATSDRDEKIRISRFQQPWVIEAFCLGHTSFISQVKFLPGSHLLVSSGGDGHLRLWQSETGTQLSHKEMSFELRHVSSDNDEKPVIISRLMVSEPGICFGSSSSHPFAFAVGVHTKPDETAHFGDIVFQRSPNNQPFLDSCLCIVPDSGDSSRAVFVGLLAGDIPDIVYWSINLANFPEETLSWHKLSTIDSFPPSLLVLPDPIPRMVLLKCLEKSEVDRSMIEMYNENKPRRHQSVSDRRLRHQQKRQAKKRLKQMNPELCDE